MMNKPLIVNLVGAPGAGKSTLAAIIFSKLKMAGVNCELVTEFAKDKVWEENNAALVNQVYIFAKQYFRISRCADKVDVIVTDSPLFLSPFYNKDKDIDKPLKDLVFAISGKYDSMNYFVRRVKKYNPVGRQQTEKESNAYAGQIRSMLDSYGVKYEEIDGTLESADPIVEKIRTSLNA